MHFIHVIHCKKQPKNKHTTINDITNQKFLKILSKNVTILKVTIYLLFIEVGVGLLSETLKDLCLCVCVVRHFISIVKTSRISRPDCQDWT